MKIDFEYGHGTMAAELPDDTDVFVPGETVADPPAIPESEIVEKTRAVIQNPMGMKPIPELVGPESKVTIIFPDRVKGGSHPTAHRKVSIPILIEECVKAGVKKENLRFICSNGLHRKNRKDEIRTILGDDLFNEYWWTGQIVNHDSEDWDNLVDL